MIIWSTSHVVNCLLSFVQLVIWTIVIRPIFISPNDHLANWSFGQLVMLSIVFYHLSNWSIFYCHLANFHFFSIGHLANWLFA
jgi:hypothetical protein